MDDVMKDLENVFDEVKDKEAMYDRLPDGEYLAKIEDMVLGDSKSGKPMVTIIFEITHGEYEGKQHRKFMMLSGKDESQLKQNIHRYATEIKKLGIDTSNGIKATFDHLSDVVGTEVKLTIKTTVSKNGSEFVNTSFEIK